MITRETTKRLTAGPVKMFAVACVLLAACTAGASTNNLLANGNFTSGLSGWSTFTYGGGWTSAEIPAKLAGTTATTWPAGWPEGAGTNAAGTGPLYDGTTQLTCGGFSSAGGFAWQTVAAAENVQYTLRIQGGAENWWLPTGEIRMIWLDSTNGEISRNVVNTTDSLHNGSNGGLGDLYDVGVPYQNWTNVATAPVGTKSLKVEICNPAGTGSAWFDNAVLTAPIDPPLIANLYPDGTRLLCTNKLIFTVSSAAPINSSGVVVTVNGVDVSGSLVITGSGTTNLNVSYSGLQSNRVYTAVITVTDTVNLVSFKNVSFDTYAPSYLWEAEDYDYDNAQFINTPILSSVPTAGSYYGVSGVEGVDYHDRNGNGSHDYRSSDTMSTGGAGDIPRQNFVNAGVADYNVGYFDGAGFPSGDNVGISSYEAQEWVNYTRNFTAGTYNIYARIASGNGLTATVPVSRVVSGRGTSVQTTSDLGIFRFPALGWGVYAYVPLTDQFGNAIAVSLSGTNTLKVSAGSGANLNFFLLLPADTNTPTITGVYPDGSTLLQGTNKLSFTVSSANHSIFQSNVVVTLNGVTNNNLVFTGSASSWNVSAPLTLNVTNYITVITVADNLGNTHSTTVYFDTFLPTSYGIEAEDWDFSGGSFIDSPVITSTADPSSYFDKAGQDNVDSFVGDVAPPTTADFRYRTIDATATSVCTDTRTRAVVAAQLTDPLAFNYNVGWWSTNAWLNYSHTYPTGQFNVYARVAGADGMTNVIRLDKVGGSATNLGTFTEVGRGYNAFDWIPLVNTNSGQLATVTLGGVATLRATSMTGNVNPNSYLLVPLVLAAEPLQWSYSGGTLTLTWSNPAFHLQAQTNTLGVGLTKTWANYPGGGASPVNVTVNRSVGTVFFRLSN